MTHPVRPFKFCTPSNWFRHRVNVSLAGVGGTGSEVLACLARVDYAIRELGHPGLSVTAYDGDRVERPNIGRQAFVPADLGHNKALTLIQRVNFLYGLDWTAQPRHFSVPEDGERREIDLLISCVDVAQFRADIGKRLRERSPGLLWIDTGNGEHSGQVILGKLGHWWGDDVGLPNVFDYHPELDGMPDDGKPSCSLEEALASQDLPINRAIADVVMQLLWKLLRHGGLDQQGAYVDIRRGAVTPINIFATDPTRAAA